MTKWQSGMSFSSSNELSATIMLFSPKRNFRITSSWRRKKRWKTFSRRSSSHLFSTVHRLNGFTGGEIVQRLHRRITDEKVRPNERIFVAKTFRRVFENGVEHRGFLFSIDEDQRRPTSCRRIHRVGFETFANFEQRTKFRRRVLFDQRLRIEIFDHRFDFRSPQAKQCTSPIEKQRIGAWRWERKCRRGCWAGGVLFTGDRRQTLQLRDER